ncbi:OmpA family protein [Rufibacter quisquiliarum]|uniref:Outer membrane protein OmpA-like peptidoglycan-associated protein n=1 Tax=Rufibacter quisquiliarum TaxID=1549639 RepID=A0A839GJ55_9BACT|nr:OmpA family protein [Rufibacter quisquiliarum]MBA9079654.1 outer membrane protein OmpA-like peptidoglycan-associated protein [Rufibacter quisquiliarum]
MRAKVLVLYMFLPFLLLSSIAVLAQKQQKIADTHYQKLEFALAIEAYKKVLQTQEPTLPIIARIADSYRRLNNSKEAEFWYAQMMAFPDYDPQSLKHYADAARMNGNYEKAKNLYLTYAEQVPSATPEAMQLIATSVNAQLWMGNPQPFRVEKAPGLNSENSDFSPALFQDGLVFTSDRVDSKNNKNVLGWTGRPNSILYYSKKEAAGFSPATPLPSPIHSDHQNGSAAFSPDGNTIYFTRINQLKKQGKSVNTDPFSWVKFSVPENVNRLEIFISQRKGNGWSEPQPFPYNNPGTYSIGHPAVSKSGDTLYFSSDMPGTLGESDIFYSVRESDNSWSKPVNLGAGINTPGKEVFPVVAPSGKLYFSSEGHQGMGGLDIFSAAGSGTVWKKVQNLKYPLNSPGDDFGIVFETTDAGYLSSNRESSDGTDDIYTFQYQPIPCKLAGRSFEKTETRPGVYEEIPVGNVLLQLYLPNDSVVATTYSDAAGNFTFDILDGVTYSIKATKPDYLTRSAAVTPTCESIVDMVRLGLALNRSAPNKPILVENIYYDLNKSDIRPEAALELDKLVQTLKDNPKISIELSSHTDSRQTAAYNKILSQLRAQTAVNYIISKGIDATRVVAKGYGETKLLNRCKDGVPCSEEEHQVNRRTEFKILKRK